MPLFLLISYPELTFIYNNEKRAYLPELEWIQGIGSKLGIFSYNDIYGSYGDCGPVLSCLWSGGQLVYKNPFFKYSGSYDIVVPISSGKALFPSEEYFPDIQGNDQHLTFQLTGDSLNISGNIVSHAGGGISLKYEIYEDSVFIEPIADDRDRYTYFWNYPLNVNIGRCNADRYKIFYKGYPHVNTTVSRSDETDQNIPFNKEQTWTILRSHINTAYAIEGVWNIDSVFFQGVIGYNEKAYQKIYRYSVGEGCTDTGHGLRYEDGKVLLYVEDDEAIDLYKSMGASFDGKVSLLFDENATDKGLVWEYQAMGIVAVTDSFFADCNKWRKCWWRSGELSDVVAWIEGVGNPGWGILPPYYIHQSDSRIDDVLYSRQQESIIYKGDLILL